MKSILLLPILLSFFSNVLSQTFIPLSSGTSNHISAVDFVTDNIGYIAGYNGTIKKTIDGGVTFTLQTTGTSSNIYDIEFMNKDTGFAIGDGGTLIRTLNGGINWTSVYTGSIIFDRISFNGNIIFCSGNNGTLLKSTDYGNSWISITTGTTGTIYDIFWTSPSIGYFVEWGHIRKTTNGGNTWASLSVSGISNTNLLSIYFIDSNNGIAVGGTNANDGTILRTSNAGLTWTSQTIVNNRFQDVFFINSSVGYIAGGSITSNTSTILKTVNSGNTWFTVNSNSNRQLNLSFPSNNVGYSSGLNGSILKTEGMILEVNELTSNNKINIYPNPSSDIVNISFNSISKKDLFEIELYNPSGKSLLKNKDVTNIDISDLPTGIYFLNLYYEGKVYSKKIIKN